MLGIMKYRQRCSVESGVDILLKLPGKQACARCSQGKSGSWPRRMNRELENSAWVVMGNRILVSFSHCMSQCRYVYGIVLLISNQLPCAYFVSSLTVEIFYSTTLDNAERRKYILIMGRTLVIDILLLMTFSENIY